LRQVYAVGTHPRNIKQLANGGLAFIPAAHAALKGKKGWDMSAQLLSR